MQKKRSEPVARDVTTLREKEMEAIAKGPFGSCVERKKDCRFRRLGGLQEACRFTAVGGLKRKKERQKERKKRKKRKKEKKKRKKERKKEGRKEKKEKKEREREL